MKTKTVGIGLTGDEYKKLIMKIQEQEKPGERISTSEFLRQIILKNLDIESIDNEEK